MIGIWMRTIVVTVLLVIFVGVNMTAAFAGARKAAVALDPPAVSQMDAGTTSALPHPSRLTCCDKTDRKGPAAKTSYCGADCVSLQAVVSDLPGPAAALIEITPSAELKAVTPVPTYHPPIRA